MNFGQYFDFSAAFQLSLVLLFILSSLGVKYMKAKDSLKTGAFLVVAIAVLALFTIIPMSKPVEAG